VSDEVLSGRYRLIRVLGEGGMARVHEAEDLRLGRRVAVKILLRQFTADAEFLRRFEQEARLAASLSHPNIVGVYDVGQDGVNHYIVMELVDGRTLKDAIKQSAPLPIPEAVRIALEVCAALSAAHGRNLIHRDIKPQNILLTSSSQVKVVDFGIARRTSSQTLTQTGTVLGSVHYLSPEQATGQEAGPRADLYSLGVTLFEMVTGRLPFDAENPVAVAMQHVQSAPPLPRQFNRSIPPALETLILRLLAKNPAERFADAGAVAEALRAVLSQASGHTRVISRPVPQAVPPVAAATAAPALASRTRVMPVTAAPLVPPPPVPVRARPRGGRRSVLIGIAFGGALGIVVLVVLALLGSGGSLGFGGGSAATPTALPSPTVTSQPSPTHRPRPSATARSIVVATKATSTPTRPTDTATVNLLPTATAGAAFTATDTPVPPTPSATDTPFPTRTFTATPTATASSTPSDTPVPTDTFTPLPTATPSPSDTATLVPPTATQLPPTPVPSVVVPATSPTGARSATPARSPLPSPNATPVGSPLPSPDATPAGSPPPDLSTTPLAGPTATFVG
jgi:predicted Ser/Thr protein kinase